MVRLLTPANCPLTSYTVCGNTCHSNHQINKFNKKIFRAGYSSICLLIPAHGKQRQKDFYEFKDRLHREILSQKISTFLEIYIISTFLDYLFICLFIYYAYSVLLACIPTGQKGAPDLIMDGCESPRGCWELNSGPREEQPVLLTSEPSFRGVKTITFTPQ